MKVRDSGMPDEEIWTGFFEPSKVLSIFGLDRGVQDLVEFGCGYGTFTLAAAGITAGTVHALDIEPEMVAVIRQKCAAAAITNVRAAAHDFVADLEGTTRKLPVAIRKVMGNLRFPLDKTYHGCPGIISHLPMMSSSSRTRKRG